MQDRTPTLQELGLRLITLHRAGYRPDPSYTMFEPARQFGENAYEMNVVALPPTPKKAHDLARRRRKEARSLVWGVLLGGLLGAALIAWLLLSGGLS